MGYRSYSFTYKPFLKIPPAVLCHFADKKFHHQLLTALSAHVLKLFFADKDIFQLSGHQKIHVFAVNPIFFPPIVFKFLSSLCISLLLQIFFAKYPQHQSILTFLLISHFYCPSTIFKYLYIEFLLRHANRANSDKFIPPLAYCG